MRERESLRENASESESDLVVFIIEFDANADTRASVGVYNVHNTLYTVHYTLYNIYCKVYTVHNTQYNIHCTIYSVKCIL